MGGDERISRGGGARRALAERERERGVARSTRAAVRARTRGPRVDAHGTAGARDRDRGGLPRPGGTKTKQATGRRGRTTRTPKARGKGGGGGIAHPDEHELVLRQRRHPEDAIAPGARVGSGRVGGGEDEQVAKNRIRIEVTANQLRKKFHCSNFEDLPHFVRELARRVRVGAANAVANAAWQSRTRARERLTRQATARFRARFAGPRERSREEGPAPPPPPPSFRSETMPKVTAKTDGVGDAIVNRNRGRDATMDDVMRPVFPPPGVAEFRQEVRDRKARRRPRVHPETTPPPPIFSAPRGRALLAAAARVSETPPPIFPFPAPSPGSTHR